MAERRFPEWALDAVDIAVAVAFLALGVGNLYEVQGTGYREGDLLGIILVAIQTVPLAVRRRSPLPVYVVMSAGIVAFAVLQYEPQSTTWANLVGFYTVASIIPFRRAWPAFALALVGIIAAFWAAPGPIELVNVGTAALAWTLAWSLGRVSFSRRLYLDQVELRAAELARSRRTEMERAVADERNRIARDMHDAIGHAVSLMVLHAGAGRTVAHQHPDAAADAFQTIEETGRRSMEDLDQLLGLLRGEDSAERRPGPDLAQLDDLIESFRTAGLEIELTTNGSVTGVGVNVAQSAYRIIQEALTNTIKHGGPSVRADVRLDVGPNTMVIDIRDDGRGRLPNNGSGGGRGLVGIRERVALVHGSVTAGPGPSGGFRVHCELPLTKGTA